MNELLVHLESAGRALASWLGPINLWTAALLAGAMLLDRALSRSARASWRIALYAPIALRVALPLHWSIPLAHAPRVVTLLTPVPDVAPPPVVASSGGVAVTWHAALALAYVAVMLFLAVRAVRARTSLRRAIAHAAPLDVGGVAGGHPVVQHEKLGPMVVGLLSPTIVVPRKLVEQGGAHAVSCVLRHELAHVRRHDAWLSAAMQVLVATAWPVVPVWIALGRVRHLVELACDEAALDDADADERRRYGHALLDIAEWSSLVATPLGAGELHFGATLRARIEALASQRHWPHAVQVGLVVAVAAGFAACSSVGPAPASGSHEHANDESTRPISPFKSVIVAGGVQLRTWKDLQASCPHFVERASNDDTGNGFRWWMEGGADGLPADEVALCRSPGLLEAIGDGLWLMEAYNAMGQMAKDIAVAYEGAGGTTASGSSSKLCPSGSPEPAQPQAPGQKYVPTSQDWTGAGWECIRFSMTAPFSFQYAFVTDDKTMTITAHAQRPKGDHAFDVRLTLRGEIQANNVLNIAPNIELNAKEVP